MSSQHKERVPAIEGWFSEGGGDGEVRLVGLRCPTCGTYVFPPKALACPNPACEATELERAELSRTGTVWSYTVNHYAPPEPFMAPDPFEPYGVAAVELTDEKLVVLGQVAGDLDRLEVGAPAELVVDTLYEDGDHEYVVWKWKVVEA